MRIRSHGGSRGGHSCGLTHIDIDIVDVARAATTSDPANAIAEPRRRGILIERGFDAGEHLVYRSYTTPDLGVGQPDLCSRLRTLISSS